MPYGQKIGSTFVQQAYPFITNATVILDNHLHILTLQMLRVIVDNHLLTHLQQMLQE